MHPFEVYSLSLDRCATCVATTTIKIQNIPVNPKHIFMPFCSQSPPKLTPDNLWSVTVMKSYIFPCLDSFSIVLLRFSHIVAYVSSSFLLLLIHVLLDGYIKICLAIHQWIDIWVVSSFQLLWIKLLQLLWIKLLSTCAYMFLCGQVFFW